MKLSIKIKTIFIVAIYMWKHPHPLNESIFQLMSQIMEFILKVAKEEKPYMCNFGIIQTDKKEHAIVSLWAGAGIGADPLLRIKELLDENQQLKSEIMKLSKI